MIVARASLPMTRLLLGVGFALFVACMPASAKCPLIYIEFEGEIAGAPVGEHDRVVVEVEPDPNAPRDAVHIEENRFRIEVPFDTTKSGGRFHHNCSRRPSTVAVILLSNDEEAARVALSIEEDFKEDDEGDYRVLSPVQLEKPN